MEADPALTAGVSGCGSSCGCERLKKGEIFQNFDDFQYVIEHYKKCNDVVFVTYNATTAANYNRKKAKSEEAKCPLAWKYKYANFHCKHHDKYWWNTSTRSRGKGIKNKKCR